MSPVEHQVTAIADSISRAEGVTASELLKLLGDASFPMVILVLSVLNMIPGPPGYGGSIAIAIMVVTATMMMGRPLRLGGWIGRRALPASLLARMIGQMHWLARLIARVSRPRLLALTGPRTETALAVFILLVSLPMVLPIPFINAVPNTGIAVICVSRINRDGLGVILGVVIALIGLAIAAGAIWGAIHLAQTVLGT